MSPPNDRPKRRSQAIRRAEAEEKLLEAAILCVANHGVEGFTLHDVGKEAGVSRGLVNYHFETKRGLVDRLTEWLFDSEGLGDLAIQSTNGLGPLLKAIGSYFDNLVSDPNACRALCVLQGYALTDKRIAVKLAELNVRALAAIEAHLKAGLECGEVNGADLPPS